MLKRIFYIFMLMAPGMAGAYAQSGHYVQTDAIKIAGVTTDSAINALTASQKQTSRTYLDGFGRPIQSVAVKGSPLHKDMVQPVVYDTLGRNTFNYLPYVSSDTTGAYHSDALTQQHSFYTSPYPYNRIARDTVPYSHQLMENSPLQRLLEAGSVGAGFQPGQHYKSVFYGSNVSADSVRLFLPDGSSSAIYASGTLTYVKATDEQGQAITTFTDNMGQTILKRQLGPSSGRVDTYYIYNNNGSVAYVVPPVAVALMKQAGTYNLSVTGVDKLLFKYVYDGQARLTTKTIPGAGKMYIVYDTLQRPVLLQDANLRTHHQWDYIKYDSKGRAISQGIYTDNTYTTLDSMQTYVNSINYNTNYAEQRSTSGTNQYYTNNVFPTTNTIPLAYSYYDDYHITNTNTPDYSYVNQGLSGELATADTLVNGMLTVVKKKTVGTGIAATWLTSVVFYDSRGRTIQTQGDNLLHNNTMADKGTVVTDFTGKPLITQTVKTSGVSTTITVETALTYDAGDRVTAVDQKYNGGGSKRIANYQYNELGQLIKKNLGRLNSGGSYPYHVTLNGTISTTTNTVAQNQIILEPNFQATATSAPLSYSAEIKTDYLQALDYRYNIRGALLSMNNATLTVDTLNNPDANDLFGMEMLYDQSDGGLSNTPYYNGQLSAIKWMDRTATGQKTNEKSYVYSYDELQRLTNALYKEKGASSWNVNVGAFDEKSISYDQNGNIKTLKRNSLISGAVTKIDSLVYSYIGNQLNNVTDGTGTNYTQNGYKNLTGSADTATYKYDANGNLTVDPRKGITNHYNILNRVDSIRVTAGTNQWITYTYGSDGVLLRKVQYKTSGTVPVMTTDYLDGFVYENGTLAYFATNEGRVRDSSGTLINEFVITDTQGNSRISFEDNGSGRAVVRQENGYYPFGLIMGNGVTPTSQPNKNLYNGGSEWQNDYVDLPDYYQTFFRNYDAALGRWIGIDVQSESTESMTPYQYAYNLPNMRNDPTGAQVPMAHEVVDLEKVAHYEEERERNLMYSQYATRAYQGKLQEMVDANNDVEEQNYDNMNADAAEAAGVVWSANSNQNSIQGFLNVINNGGNIKWGSGGTDFYYQRDSRSQLTPEEQKLSSTGLAYAGGSESVHVFLPGDGANQGGSMFGSLALTGMPTDGIFDKSFHEWYDAAGKMLAGETVPAILSSLSKDAKILRIGTGASVGIALIGLGMDYAAYRKGEISGGKFLLNQTMSAVGFFPPYGTAASAIYFGVDAFYPGGWSGVGSDISNSVSNTWGQFTQGINQYNNIYKWVPHQ